MGHVTSNVLIQFCNPILIDVFGEYMDNSVLASFVSESGEICLELSSKSEIVAPEKCEELLSMLFMLLEENTDKTAGKAYAARKNEIICAAMYRLAQVLDGFGSVKMVIDTCTENPDDKAQKVNKHTEFTLVRTKETNTSSK